MIVPVKSIFDEYHCWYYSAEVWRQIEFLGVPCAKSVSDLWNYQEIISDLQPSLVVEFGTHAGGSALYFAEMMFLATGRGTVLTVDIDHSKVYERVRLHPRIELLQADSTSALVAERIELLRAEHIGPVFFIIDSNHEKNHVLRELLQLRPLTASGDYVVVEDGNINGHPVLPNWGPGPYEALQEYSAQYPNDYRMDVKREQKFGFTFAPKGFLIRL